MVASKDLLDDVAAIVTALRALGFEPEQDLLRLKKTAKARRSSPADAQDIAFLEARRRAANE
jgi:hypothetical protein